MDELRVWIMMTWLLLLTQSFLVFWYLHPWLSLMNPVWSLCTLLHLTVGSYWIFGCFVSCSATAACGSGMTCWTEMESETGRIYDSASACPNSEASSECQQTVLTCLQWDLLSFWRWRSPLKLFYTFVMENKRGITSLSVKL